MPIYEYKCEQTSEVYEVRQGINDAPLEFCELPNCRCEGKSRTQRIISNGVGLLFKGSGFYATDYKNGTPQHNEASHPAGCSCCHSANTCPNAVV